MPRHVASLFVYLKDSVIVESDDRNEYKGNGENKPLCLCKVK